MAGVFIAGMGLPGAGKSTVMAALADLLLRKDIPTSIYREPEESEWPICLKNREEYGYITALTWFRSVRVPYIYQANNDRQQGKVAIVDSYYDKLIHLYFNEPGFEWLMPLDDPYRQSFDELARNDYHQLPDSDCVVSFTVGKSRWEELVKGRGRELDRNSELLNYHHMHDVFLKATQKYCDSKKVKHIIFQNTQSSLASAAESLFNQLIKEGVINHEQSQ